MVGLERMTVKAAVGAEVAVSLLPMSAMSGATDSTRMVTSALAFWLPMSWSVAVIVGVPLLATVALASLLCKQMSEARLIARMGPARRSFLIKLISFSSSG